MHQCIIAIAYHRSHVYILCTIIFVTLHKIHIIVQCDMYKGIICNEMFASFLFLSDGSDGKNAGRYRLRYLSRAPWTVICPPFSHMCKTDWYWKIWRRCYCNDAVSYNLTHQTDTLYTYIHMHIKDTSVTTISSIT